jgi:arabinogalactan endo-1,4-beta-galactosidase
MKFKMMMSGLLFTLLLFVSGCKDSTHTDPTPVETKLTYYGADLSYANQILDHGGVFKDGGEARTPYKIFKDHGTNLVRLRLWHNPAWTKELYGASGTQLYNDLYDVEKSIKLSKEQGLQVLLDFHYSDSWADPARQDVPAAWADITDIAVLKDSVYNYTFKVLSYLNGKGLMPELVQVGNETNCGMMFTNAKAEFPTCNVCNGQWSQMGGVINKAIDAIKNVSAVSSIKTKIILHVADPKNVTWWFDNITTKGGVSNFDIVGFSYYPIWHTTVAINDISTNVSAFKSKYNKDVMIMETAFPWTPDGDDSYNNQFGGTTPFPSYPFTQQGQLDLMKKLVQEMKDGGGIGVIVWEPDWITSTMKDSWGTGSSFENCAFFDFEGNTVKGIDFAK